MKLSTVATFFSIPLLASSAYGFTTQNPTATKFGTSIVKPAFSTAASSQLHTPGPITAVTKEEDLELTIKVIMDNAVVVEKLKEVESRKGLRKLLYKMKASVSKVLSKEE